MTAALRAKISALMKAAHAAAHLSREHREAGRLSEYLNESAHACQLAEDARISRGDPDALADRAQRLLFEAHLRDWERDMQIADLKGVLERTALEAARMALVDLRRKHPYEVQPLAYPWLEPQLLHADRQYHAPIDPEASEEPVAEALNRKRGGGECYADSRRPVLWPRRLD